MHRTAPAGAIAIRFAAAGLREGDSILQIDGEKVEAAESFRKLLRRGVVRGKAILQVRRDSKTFDAFFRCPD